MAFKRSPDDSDKQQVWKTQDLVTSKFPSLYELKPGPYQPVAVYTTDFHFAVKQEIKKRDL